MLAAHGHSHPPDPARECSASQQAAPVQGFDSGAFVDPEFPQPLRLTQRKAAPIHTVDIGGQA